MTGIDTNVLVRYFVQDEVDQASQAIDLIDHRLSRPNEGFVSLVTIAELVWVLTNTYRFSRDSVADAIEYLLSLSTIHVQNTQQVYLAANALRSGAGSFPDALVGDLGLWAGCSATMTFDRKAARLPSFQLL